MRGKKSFAPGLRSAVTSCHKLALSVHSYGRPKWLKTLKRRRDRRAPQSSSWSSALSGFSNGRVRQKNLLTARGFRRQHHPRDTPSPPPTPPGNRGRKKTPDALSSPGFLSTMERATGFEPATSTLARLHSTAELRPHRDLDCRQTDRGLSTGGRHWRETLAGDTPRQNTRHEKIQEMSP